MKKTTASLRSESPLTCAAATLLATVACAALLAVPARGQGSPNIVISQVYGGGGNSGATYKNDFVELFNRGSVSVDITGWSVQYGSASNTSWVARTELTGVIEPGHYFLIREAAGSGGTVDLPTPDVDGAAQAGGTLSMSGTNGKVALVSNSTLLGSGCTSANIVDLVGYGSAPCHEGSAGTSALSNTTAVSRKDGGCTDTDSNADDFDAPAAPNPRNSASPAHPCGPTELGGVLQAEPSSPFAGATVLLTVTVSPANPPPSTGITVEGNLSTLGGATSQLFTETGPGSNVFTHELSIPCSANTDVANSDRTVSVTINDAQSRSALAETTVTLRPSTTKIGVTLPPGAPPDDGQPVAASVCPGETATFSVRAEGPNLTYRWYDGSGTPLNDDDRITGTMTAILKIANVQAADAAAGPYKVLVTGSCSGSVESETAALTIATPPTDEQKQIVISQVYGGGGNTGSTFTNDFIELFNGGDTAVDVTGWSVQYASSNVGSQPSFDSPSRLTVLSGVIEPGHFFLIQESQGNGGSVVLPTPDVDGTEQTAILIGSQGGKVALVNNSSPLAGTCPSGDGTTPTACGMVDFVGWGDNVGCAENGTAAPATSNTTAVTRSSPCVDTDDNGADFVAAFPVPRNSGFDSTPQIGIDPTDQPFCEGQAAVFSVQATGACLSYQWQISHGEGWENVTAGEGADTPTYTTEPLSASADGTQYRVVVSGPFGSSAESAPATVVYDPVDDYEKQVVISQIYPSGGNTGGTVPAIYKQDFIELYNRGTAPVDLSNWTVQYAAAEGENWSRASLAGTLEPGAHYLIQAAGGSGGSVDIPSPDATATFGMGGSGGKVALVRGRTALPVSSCPTVCQIVDLVGYGTADCSEGAVAPFATTDNTLALVRSPICSDTDQNAADFKVLPVSPRRIPGNFNTDLKVDQSDYEAFAGCATGPDVPVVASECLGKDLDEDNDVDQADFGLFQRCYSGTDDANPSCLCE